MNLPECSNQNISNKNKKVFTKIQCPNNFTFVRIISNLHEFISSGGGGGQVPQYFRRTPKIIMRYSRSRQTFLVLRTGFELKFCRGPAFEKVQMPSYTP